MENWNQIPVLQQNTSAHIKLRKHNINETS